MSKSLKKYLIVSLGIFLFPIFSSEISWANLDDTCPISYCPSWNSCSCSWSDWKNGSRTCTGTQSCTKSTIGTLCTNRPISCQIIETDDTPPTLTTQKQIFVANDKLAGEITFEDSISAPAYATITIKMANGEEKTYTESEIDNQTATVYFQDHDFSEADDYDLTYYVEDQAGNNTTTTYADFFKVVANVPDINQSSITVSNLDETKVADGAEKHFLKAELTDEHGNSVIPVAGLKKVTVGFNFADTTAIDQFAADPVSSINFQASEFSLNCDGIYYDTESCSNELVEAADDADGIYQIDLSSYAPTSAGYNPIADADFNLNFSDLDFTIENLAGEEFGDYVVLSVGAVDSATLGPDLASEEETLEAFKFSPALESTLEATNYLNGEFIPESESETDDSALNNITVDALKRFVQTLDNESTTQSITVIHLGYVFEDIVDSLNWISTYFEKIGGGILDTLASFNIMSEHPTDQPTFNNLTDYLTSISPQESTSIRFQAKPELAACDIINEDLNSELQTYLQYQVNGKTVAHKSQTITNPTEAEPQIYLPNLNITGTIYGESNSCTDAEITSIGDTYLEEFQTAIATNTTPYTASGSNITGCQAYDPITNLQEFKNQNPNCEIDEEVLFFTSDVTLDLNDQLTDEAQTILIHGGNLILKNNLTSSDQSENILGIILVADDYGQGGNLLLQPNITKIEAAIYAEGSLISVNAENQLVEDTSEDCDSSTGFCDRAFELHNQLCLNGVLVAQNTIGGANQQNPECPTNPMITTCNKASALIFDLFYLRTFHPEAGGEQCDTSSDAAVIIKYDSRVQTATPPLFSK